MLSNNVRHTQTAPFTIVLAQHALPTRLHNATSPHSVVFPNLSRNFFPVSVILGCLTSWRGFRFRYKYAFTIVNFL